jgi:hypothetical protein
MVSSYKHTIVQKTDEPLFVKHEGKLRSYAWSMLEDYAAEGDWILSIDCDEELYGTENLKTLMKNPNNEVLGIEFYHMWDPTHYRVDKMWAPVISSRMYRYHLDGKFVQRRLACGSEPTYVKGFLGTRKFCVNTGLKMKHLGYQDDEDKQNKYKRYMELDNGEFHNIKHIKSIVDNSVKLEKWNYG